MTDYLLDANVFINRNIKIPNARVGLRLRTA